MGKSLFETNRTARQLFEQADEVLGYSLTEVMFGGDEEQLRQTRITQPAIFAHSVITYLAAEEVPEPDAVAGHSLGEFSALVAAGTLSFPDALRLVGRRALAMQKAAEAEAGTMAAVLGLDDATIEEACAGIEETVVAANYNCPGQLVISGSEAGIDLATRVLTDLGARRVLKLPVGGAFHSPLMAPAAASLREAIDAVDFRPPGLPDLPERRRRPQRQTSRDPRQVDRPAHLTGAVDANRAAHASRRGDRVRRGRGKG